MRRLRIISLFILMATFVIQWAVVSHFDTENQKIDTYVLNYAITRLAHQNYLILYNQSQEKEYLKKAGVALSNALTFVLMEAGAKDKVEKVKNLRSEANKIADMFDYVSFVKLCNEEEVKFSKTWENRSAKLIKYKKISWWIYGIFSLFAITLNFLSDGPTTKKKTKGKKK